MSVSPLKPTDHRSAALGRVGIRLQARIRPLHSGYSVAFLIHLTDVRRNEAALRVFPARTLKLSVATSMRVAIRSSGALRFMNVSFINMKKIRQATPSHQRV
jgi:hypothetical protein